MILNHLWQSTLVVGAAALLSVALRRNRPQLRYWLWLTASLKFLVPFAILVALGNQLAWRAPVAGNSPITIVIDAVSEPFTPVAATGDAVVSAPLLPSRVLQALPFVLLTVWAVGVAAMLIIWLVRWRRVALLIREGVPVDGGRELAILRRLEATSSGLPQALPLVVANASLEPGVFGIWRPVLLWPSSISARLTDAQIEAILAHELAHVRRRDNLAAALHMAVQSLFWFHPAVWWIGARLVDERERACDADVIRQGSVPQVYAESILRTCEFYVESPIACVSGVTGSDLKRRIEQIMRGEGGVALAGWRKLLVATVGLTAIAGPLAAGMLNGSPLSAQPSALAATSASFDVASIKQNKSGNTPPGNSRSLSLPGGQFVAVNMTLRALISNAYSAPLQPLLRAQLVGGPSWLDTDRFDIVAKAERGLSPGPDSPLPLMIRALLAERFNLVVHNETRDLSTYALVMAGNDERPGPLLKTSAFDCRPRRGTQPPPPPPAPPLPGDTRPRCGLQLLAGSISAGGVTMAQFANALSRLPAVSRPVQDFTSLKGGFDLDLTWTPAPIGPSIFTAVQEQLGLKLEPRTGAVEVLVVDHLEKLNVEDEFETPVIAVPPPPPPPPPRRP